MSAVCGVCSILNNANDQIKCTGVCGSEFHLSCITKKHPDLIKTRGSKKEWFCSDCSKKSTKSGEGTTTITKEFMKNIMESFKEEVFSEIRANSAQFVEFKNSLDFFSTKMDEATKSMELLKQQNKEIITENENNKRKVAVLTKKVDELETKVRDMEQYSRRENMEINGLPATPGENEAEILKDLGRAIGVEVDASQIVAAHRVPTYNRTRAQPLVVRFKSRTLRDTWLQAYRKKRTVLASDVNGRFPKTRIYIGEHLTPANKLFLKTLKEAGKELGVKYVWCREGKFYARESDGKPSIRVSNIEDLRQRK